MRPPSVFSSWSTSKSASQKPFAFATLLAGHSDPKDRPENDDDDGYFLSTRLMVYQLLHSKSSAVDDNIDVVVFTTEYVPESQRKRIEKEGGKVFVVDVINGTGKNLENRWELSLRRFHMWKHEEYEKVCWIDADTLVTGQLSGVFQDPAAEVYPTLHNKSEIKTDEPSLPPTYIFADKSGSDKKGHPWPPEVTDHLNAGFFVTRPSRMLFDYYLNMLNHADRADLRFMDQGILNYALRKSGNMPWKVLHPIWNVNNPRKSDWDAGARSFHQKYSNGKGHSARRDPFLVDLFYKQSAEMEEYYSKK